MPLARGASEKVVGSNISEMESAGHPEKQSIAAALNEKRKSERRKKMFTGGPVKMEKPDASE